MSYTPTPTPTAKLVRSRRRRRVGTNMNPLRRDYGYAVAIKEASALIICAKRNLFS